MSTVFLSENTNTILKKALRDQGYELIEIRRTATVYDSISSHADIYLCKINDELVVAPVQLPMILEGLLKNGVKFTAGASEPGFRYPLNVKYNAAQIGSVLIHNRSCTDPVILEKARRFGMDLIHVKQGYTKCSLVIVDDSSVITSDGGIASALERNGFDVLVISPGHVALPGFPYGFLGGATGKIGNQIVFNGDLSAHPDFLRIKEFIERRGLRVTWFTEYPLEDIGSLIQL